MMKKSHTNTSLLLSRILGLSFVGSLLFVFVSSIDVPLAHASCQDEMKPCAWVEYHQPGATYLKVSWWYSGADPNVQANGTDFYQVRWSQGGGSETQVKVNSGGPSGSFTLPNIDPGSYYGFKVQACRSRFLQSSVCTQWSDEVYYKSYGPDTCVQGYVWRDAYAGDHVCVTPQTRTQAAYDNNQASSRINPQGAYGPDTCVQGYVWRQARSQDHVCVTPQTRSQTAFDNSQATNRRLP